MHFLIPTSASTGGGPLSSTLGFSVYTDDPTPLTLALRGGNQERTLAVQPGAPVRLGARELYSTRVSSDALRPDTVYSARLMQGSDERDRASARTWPLSLGTETSPFTLLLGSCYSTYTRSPGGNDLARLVDHLSDNRLPHAKLLCGDQVYQDIPLKDILPPAGRALEEYLLDKYLANWSASSQAPERSFGDFLRRGANLLITDDHEYWNNYPYFLSYGPHLWAGEFRARYSAIVKELALMFQHVPPTLRAFQVGSAPAPVLLLLLDGRRKRDASKNLAHDPADLTLLAKLMREAPGPVVLCLSQPLFQESAGWLKRTFLDRGFADLEDCGALVDAIAGCPHDVLVLSGDIHGGRISSARRSGSGARREQLIVEVISSPLSLVHPGAYLSELPSFAYPEPRGRGKRAGPTHAFKTTSARCARTTPSCSSSGPRAARSVAQSTTWPRVTRGASLEPLPPSRCGEPMIRTRFNPDTDAQSQLSPVKTTHSPSTWITETTRALSSVDDAAFIVLLGATDLLGFRLRVAQSSFRSDALPSFFSHAALALRSGGTLALHHVPLASSAPSAVPRHNGVETLSLASLDAVPGLYANLALLHIPLPNPEELSIAVQNLKRARLSDDLVSPIPAWLAYAWMTSGAANPLLAGLGIPSAMFVESCFTAVDVDIVAGISQRIVCPEAIWQAARFWSKSLPQASGCYELRQPAAAITIE